MVTLGAFSKKSFGVESIYGDVCALLGYILMTPQRQFRVFIQDKIHEGKACLIPTMPGTL